MRSFENLTQLNANLYITEAEREEGIILKIDKNAFGTYNGVLVVRIALGEEGKVPEIKEDEKTIPGHPNCHYGDCLDCHNVSCAIYQGYEELP